MRIHSSFHDYYDKMLALGQDPKIHYVRKTDDFWEKSRYLRSDITGLAVIKNRRFNVHFGLEIIGFCGELIPLVKVNHSEDFEGKRLYDVVSVQNYMGDGKIPEGIIDWLNDFIFPNHFVTSWIIDFKKKLLKMFSEYKTPVFYAKEESDGTRFVINPCLRELEFFRKYPAFEAWQKISHYVGNVLLEESKPVWPIPDKVKAESHGFNKYSFRKDKSEKKS